MAYTTIKKPSDYFETKLYTGDDTNNRQISLDWSPDLTWIKARNVAYGHIWYDRVRGIAKIISSSSSNAESTNANGWTNSGCTTDSFTVDRGSNETLNESGRPMVAWNWLANGAGSANTDGSISSTVSASTTSGFSIVKYTAGSSGANTDTIGHGLNSVPSMIILKTTTATDSWVVYHQSNGAGKSMVLNNTTAVATNSNIFPTTPTSSVFYPGNTATTNSSSRSYIAYCFAEKQGYSKFGSYTGNGNADGTFIYTGFKPAFVIIKRTNGADAWCLFDNKRAGFNASNYLFKPNSNDAEDTGTHIDLLSNGFKLRQTGTDKNTSGGTYIYMAFASEPLVGDNPATAR